MSPANLKNLSLVKKNKTKETKQTMAAETPEECNDCNKRQQQWCDKGLLMGQKISSNDSDMESNPSRISLNLLQSLQAFMQFVFKLSWDR